MGKRWMGRRGGLIGVKLEYRVNWHFQLVMDSMIKPTFCVYFLTYLSPNTNLGDWHRYRVIVCGGENEMNELFMKK